MPPALLEQCLQWLATNPSQNLTAVSNGVSILLEPNQPRLLDAVLILMRSELRYKRFQDALSRKELAATVVDEMHRQCAACAEDIAQQQDEIRKALLQKARGLEAMAFEAYPEPPKFDEVIAGLPSPDIRENDVQRSSTTLCVEVQELYELASTANSALVENFLTQKAAFVDGSDAAADLAIANANLTRNLDAGNLMPAVQQALENEVSSAEKLLEELSEQWFSDNATTLLQWQEDLHKLVAPDINGAWAAYVERNTVNASIVHAECFASAWISWARKVQNQAVTRTKVLADCFADVKAVLPHDLHKHFQLSRQQLLAALDHSIETVRKGNPAASAKLCDKTAVYAAVASVQRAEVFLLPLMASELNFQGFPKIRAQFSEKLLMQHSTYMDKHNGKWKGPKSLTEEAQTLNVFCPDELDILDMLEKASSSFRRGGPAGRTAPQDLSVPDISSLWSPPWRVGELPLSSKTLQAPFHEELPEPQRALMDAELKPTTAEKWWPFQSLREHTEYFDHPDFSEEDLRWAVRKASSRNNPVPFVECGKRMFAPDGHWWPSNGFNTTPQLEKDHPKYRGEQSLEFQAYNGFGVPCSESGPTFCLPLSPIPLTGAPAAFEPNERNEQERFPIRFIPRWSTSQRLGTYTTNDFGDHPVFVAYAVPEEAFPDLNLAMSAFLRKFVDISILPREPLADQIRIPNPKAAGCISLFTFKNQHCESAFVTALDSSRVTGYEWGPSRKERFSLTRIVEDFPAVFDGASKFKLATNFSTIQFAFLGARWKEIGQASDKDLADFMRSEYNEELTSGRFSRQWPKWLFGWWAKLTQAARWSATSAQTKTVQNNEKVRAYPVKFFGGFANCKNPSCSCLAEDANKPDLKTDPKTGEKKWHSMCEKIRDDAGNVCGGDKNDPHHECVNPIESARALETVFNEIADLFQQLSDLGVEMTKEGYIGGIRVKNLPHRSVQEEVLFPLILLFRRAIRKIDGNWNFHNVSFAGASTCFSSEIEHFLKWMRFRILDVKCFTHFGFVNLLPADNKMTPIWQFVAREIQKYNKDPRRRVQSLSILHTPINRQDLMRLVDSIAVAQAAIRQSSTRHASIEPFFLDVRLNDEAAAWKDEIRERFVSTALSENNYKVHEFGVCFTGPDRWCGNGLCQTKYAKHTDLHVALDQPSINMPERFLLPYRCSWNRVLPGRLSSQLWQCCTRASYWAASSSKAQSSGQNPYREFLLQGRALQL